jgi:hypothetical protein
MHHTECWLGTGVWGSNPGRSDTFFALLQNVQTDSEVHKLPSPWKVKLPPGSKTAGA